MNNRQWTNLRFASCCLCLLGVVCWPTFLTAQQRGMSREEVLDALERGAAALQTIDRPDQADQLLRILNEYRQPRRERNRDSARANSQLTEREIGRQHVKQMLMAFEALRQAEKNDAADLLEHAIDARRLRLEGADGPAAKEVFGSAPSRDEEIELLLMAAELLEASGKSDQARVVRDLGEKFLETGNRNRRRAQAQGRMSNRPPDQASGEEQTQRRDERQRREEAETREEMQRHEEMQRREETQRREERLRREEAETREEMQRREREREFQSVIESLYAQSRRHQEAIADLSEQLKRIAESNDQLQQQLRRVLNRQ